MLHMISPNCAMSMDVINCAAHPCSAGMFVGAALLGVHMALTQSAITAMAAYYMLLIWRFFNPQHTAAAFLHPSYAGHEPP
jgi:hypothetical protein